MSHRATQRRPGTSAPSDGSRTITLTGAQPQEGDDSGEGSSSEPAVGTLKLRGATRKTRQRVVWSDDVVDNEGCGRKSSKICCIYHKPKAFDESSSEEDSDSDSDDSSCGGHHDHNRQVRSSDSSGEGLQSRQSSNSVAQVESDDSDRNAYEIAPSSKKGKHKAAGAFTTLMLVEYRANSVFKHE
ncbi:Type 1 phosphatases regulator ypi1 [Marasmius crinis-equi]|uniref:Type 1 phosphatases regulator n=1 Tax=Marasmius crinis-equi TaxID=585013 RepID=A0ABR3FGY5_9AGAR